MFVQQLSGWGIKMFNSYLIKFIFLMFLMQNVFAIEIEHGKENYVHKVPLNSANFYDEKIVMNFDTIERFIKKNYIKTSESSVNHERLNNFNFYNEKSVTNFEAIEEFIKKNYLKNPECSTFNTCSKINKVQLKDVGGNKIEVTYEIVARAATFVELPVLSGATMKSLSYTDGGALFSRRFGDKIVVKVKPGVNIIKTSNVVLPLVSSISLISSTEIGHIDWEMSGWESTEESQRLSAKVFNKVTAKLKEEAQDKGLEQEKQIEFDGAVFVEVERLIKINSNNITGKLFVKRSGRQELPYEVKVGISNREKVISSGTKSEQGIVTISFAPGETHKVIDTLWEGLDGFELKYGQKANENEIIQENWIIESHPRLQVSFNGLEPLNDAYLSNILPVEEGFSRAIFLPFSGDNLLVKVLSPKAKGGFFAAYDSVFITTELGEEKLIHKAQVNVRSSTAGIVTWRLEDGVQLSTVSSQPSGAVQSQFNNGLLQLDVPVGESVLNLVFEQKREGFKVKAPLIVFDAPVANLSWNVLANKSEWVVWVASNGLGPAVLVWGLLFVVVLLSFVFKRFFQAPFFPSTIGWVGLLAPLVTLSAFAVSVIVLFIVALEFKFRKFSKELPEKLEKIKYWNLYQFLLLGLAFASFNYFLSGVYQGLLGTPDMMVRSFDLSKGIFYFFMDKANKEFLDAYVVSIPLWWWRILILIWALWISKVLVGRMGGIWGLLCFGGLWHRAAGKTDKLDDFFENGHSGDKAVPCVDKELKSKNIAEEVPNVDEVGADKESPEADDIVDGDFSKKSKS